MQITDEIIEQIERLKEHQHNLIEAEKSPKKVIPLTDKILSLSMELDRLNRGPYGRGKTGRIYFCVVGYNLPA